MGILISVIVLTACNGGKVRNEEKVELERASEKAANDMEQLRLSERARLALTHKGQGCPGRVLEGAELQNAVAGKLDGGLAFPSQPLRYHRNGTFEQATAQLELPQHPNEPTVRQYRAEGQQLCFYIAYSDKRLDNNILRTCSRIIRTAKAEIYGENLTFGNSEKLTLSCRKLNLRFFEEKE